MIAAGKYRIYKSYTPRISEGNLSGNFPKTGSFLSGFPGISEKLGEKISRNSPDATFSPWFTERFPENARKSRGKSRGEIFPSGSFPDFPKFSRREIFSTKFHHNITNKLYLHNCLQPVNHKFTKVVTREVRREICREISRKREVSCQVFREFRRNSGRKFPEILPTQLFHLGLQSGFRKMPENPGGNPGGKFSRREVSRISRNSPDGKFSPQIFATTLLTNYTCVIGCSR